MGRGVSVGEAVSVEMVGVSVKGIASGVGDEQEMRRRMKNEEYRVQNTACLYMGGFYRLSQNYVNFLLKIMKENQSFLPHYAILCNRNGIVSFFDNEASQDILD